MRFEASEIARRFHRWTELFGLGFSVQRAPSVTVPAYTGRVAIYARPRPAPGWRVQCSPSSAWSSGRWSPSCCSPTVPADMTRYVAMGVVAAVDASFGGVRAYVEHTFNDRVFVLAFVSNAVVAVGLVWLGDQLARRPHHRRRRRVRHPHLPEPRRLRRRLFGG